MQSLLPLFGTSPNWKIATKSCCTHYPQKPALSVQSSDRLARLCRVNSEQDPPPHFQKNENGGGENGWKLLIIKEGKGNCVSGFNNG
jgi:hypothetical protein